jgi:hypothetical protein
MDMEIITIWGKQEAKTLQGISTIRQSTQLRVSSQKCLHND